MKTFTRRQFEQYGKVREKRGHVPTIAIRGSTVRVTCSCGVILGGGRGCNRSGMSYVIAWARNKYIEHTSKLDSSK